MDLLRGIRMICVENLRNHASCENVKLRMNLVMEMGRDVVFSSSDELCGTLACRCPNLRIPLKP
jgi:hypothetical protein